ncbi:hypothetical protein HanXRQr2_Chr04g0156521 [Helianthus annuus]|uniref:Uncharacterized protein n=1 Tax=Helianthus annuus TaxID=4232 RepID=A0A9K3J652_HELAN|nr:hypothetical protein HanXRQr2_Chr04g0156521 [Helianthus annuus]
MKNSNPISIFIFCLFSDSTKAKICSFSCIVSIEDFVLLQVPFLGWMAAAALNRLPTKRKSLKGNSGESANHLFLTCRFARKA